MGFGTVWPMHFIGMNALSLSNRNGFYTIYYEMWSNIASALICGFGGTLGIYLLTGKQVTLKKLLICGFLLGISIILMHYIGMYSMRCVNMKFNYLMVILSCAIAIFAAVVGTIIMYFVTHNIFRKLQPFVLTIAICGMHYTGMLKI